ncbi:helix-turn-helix transcriptional regulator [Aromatoleum toluclasticum]|uniref:helix-turn-helix transcriptional regulator n=1 Tax=Aromatoleum toluclasticum TaxID=92003 RepID=UPI000378F30F|nr:AlpA family transcriptional regulator [Aromatoleum toluclasticum]
MDRVLRLPQVKTLTGRSRSAIYADVKAGAFPAPVKIGPKASGWLESEIEAWLAKRVAESRAGHAAA